MVYAAVAACKSRLTRILVLNYDTNVHGEMHFVLLVDFMLKLLFSICTKHVR